MTAPRPTCCVFIACSLDGYIARADGSLDWLDAVQAKGEDYGYQRFFDAVDTLVVGRKTYDTVVGFGAWPWAGKRVVVLTHRPPAPVADETFFSGTVKALLGRLRRAKRRRVYVDGGDVIRQFLVARALDELTVSLIPVLLGDGVRLFPAGFPEQRLRLMESTAFPTGLVQVRYRTGPLRRRPATKRRGRG